MRFYTVFFFLFFSTLLSAQRGGDPASAGEASLQEQYEEMLRVSSNYQQYKTVRVTFLEAFMKNVTDSINTQSRELTTLREKIAGQEARISTLTASVEELGENITTLEAEKDGISLLGIPMSKTTYSIILWTAIIGLLIFALLALGRTRVAVADSREMRAHNEKVTQELEESRKQRLTVEQKLRRQLQDEINRNKI